MLPYPTPSYLPFLFQDTQRGTTTRNFNILFVLPFQGTVKAHYCSAVLSSKTKLRALALLNI